MKTKSIASRFPRHQRGMALISVLAVLFLLTLLVVTFMARTTGARASAASYRATASTAALSDTAVNLVQAQINEATTFGLNANGTATDTWASQPGAIRVYAPTTTTGGQLSKVFRLYSAAPTDPNSARVIDVSLSATDAAANAAAATALAGDLPATAAWTKAGAQWCDLNAFTPDSQGRYHFPILDPRDPGAPDPMADPTTVATLWQPASGVPALKGFSVNAPASVGIATNPAPMPVRWLYVLKDGSLVTPDTPSVATPNVLTFSGAINSSKQADIPSVANPIVGRIAFWTDDDSSKININTAAGDDVVRGSNPYASTSTFWATPEFSTATETALAANQPIAGEIQRYSGHPGTVGLNSTLSTLMGLAAPMAYDNFFSLTPRYTGGGSLSATVQVPYDGATTVPSLALTAHRLYTSVGEMLFNADRTQSKVVTLTSESRANVAVERSGFFLTAHSSSSELNLFGTPRVSMWPVSDKSPTSNTYRTSIDQLLAFDATIQQTASGQPNLFYFQRDDSTNTNTDCAIPNNVNLFNYLDQLSSSAIPGFGGNFTTNKYPNLSHTPPAMRQIIAEIFDYIRTINVLDPVMEVKPASGADYNFTYGQNWGAYMVKAHDGGYRSGGGGVQVVPSSNFGVGQSGGTANGINNWKTQGVGAFPIPVEITIDFAALGTGAEPKKIPLFPGLPANLIPAAQYNYKSVPGVPSPLLASDNITGTYDSITDHLDASPTPKPDGAGQPADGSTAMQAFIYVSFVNPAEITAQIQPSFVYSISGLNIMNVEGYTNATGLPYPPNKIGLHFPGNTANIGAPGIAYNKSGPSSDPLYFVFDNAAGSGLINGDLGDWVFGYISPTGELGRNQNNASPAWCVNLGLSQSTWNVDLSSAGANRSFPFYSQIFGLPGIQGWKGAFGSPNASAVKSSNTPQGGSAQITATDKALFQFDGSSSPLTLITYDAHRDGEDLTKAHIVARYSFSFPSTGLIQMPTYASSDGQIIGTQQGGSTDTSFNGTSDRWHSNTSYPGGGGFYANAIPKNDVVQSLVLSPTWSDVRDLAMGQVGVSGGSAFGPHPYYGQIIALTSSILVSQAHNLYADVNHPFIGNLDPVNWGRLVTETVYGNPSYKPLKTDSLSNIGIGAFNYPVVPPRLTSAGGFSTGGAAGEGAYTYAKGYSKNTGLPGDWDNGIASHSDGPWINMADEGALIDSGQGAQSGGAANNVAYYSTGNVGQKTGLNFSFSPNREIPSPIMLGSLPSGVDYMYPKPWQTLLFRPGAGAGGWGSTFSKYHWGEKDQPSQGDPADHLLLDLFWMPQAEPYPISTPLSTEGKINLNYEIQPFNYITRDTALRALFGSEQVAAMPDSAAGVYKSLASNTQSAQVSRLPIDPDETLGLNPSASANPHSQATGSGQTGSAAWYDYSTNTTRFFRSASELCEMFLVPQGYVWKVFSGSSGLATGSWYKVPGGDFALVGDNTRERPYADLYSRVTTKSNTFTVYYTVQALNNAEPHTDAGQQMWDESRGGIVGEYRGSTTLERYLDPNGRLPDYLTGATATSPALVSLEPYYKWRVLATRQFAP